VGYENSTRHRNLETVLVQVVEYLTLTDMETIN